MALPAISNGSSANSFSVESGSTKPPLPLIWTATCRRVRGSRPLQKAHDMNVVTEANISGQPIAEKPRARPVRMVRWFIIVGLLLALLVGALDGFTSFRAKKRAEVFANNKPPPTPV